MRFKETPLQLLLFLLKCTGSHVKSFVLHLIKQIPPPVIPPHVRRAQSKLLDELAQVQEDFFSSFGYTPPLGASAASALGSTAKTAGSVGPVTEIGAIGLSSISPILNDSATAHSFHSSGHRGQRDTKNEHASQWDVARHDRSRPMGRRRHATGADTAHPAAIPHGSGRRGRTDDAVLGDSGYGKDSGGSGSGGDGGRVGTTAGGAATVDGVSYGFSSAPSSRRTTSPVRPWRSLSPPAVGSDLSPSRAGWSRGRGVSSVR